MTNRLVTEPKQYRTYANNSRNSYFQVGAIHELPLQRLVLRNIMSGKITIIPGFTPPQPSPYQGGAVRRVAGDFIMGN